MPVDTAPDSLSTTLAAIADPTRRAILSRLSRGDATVNEIAEPFQVSLPAISKHLKVLEQAGLIERRREAQSRPCTLRARPLREAAEWIDRYRSHWEARLDRLEAYLDTIQATSAIPKAPHPKAPNPRAPNPKAGSRARRSNRA